MRTSLGCWTYLLARYDMLRGQTAYCLRITIFADCTLSVFHLE